MLKKWISGILCLIMMIGLVGLSGADKKAHATQLPENERVVSTVAQAEKDRQVGIFYFLWMGAISTEGPYDVTQILENDPNAGRSDAAWLAAGGGDVGDYHWWGESLFGYYRSSDAWVVERDVQMLTDAGVDFLGLDYSNAVDFSDQLLLLVEILDKYSKQGYDVPQITFITRASSGSMVMNLYKRFYLAYPQYSHLWYQMDGKPLIVGYVNDAKLTDDCRDFFTWRGPQWPRDAYDDNGFPWMDFSFPQNIYGKNTGTTVMSVSVAQHSGTLAFSSSALYGDNTNHTRSWHDGANDKSEDAYLYGYNFSEQFENAIKQDPDIIFVTGWNEWIASRQKSWNNASGKPITDPVILVDNCDINSSRDIQPMKGGYGDNYYMMLVDYIRQYKGGSAASLDAEKVAGGNGTTQVYYDYKEDTGDRNSKGFGTLVYTDTTGRNDIYKVKMANDERHLYAYAQTAENITGMGTEHCMTLFLNTGNSANYTWCGYDYAINRTAAKGNTVSVEKRTESGWKSVGTAEYILSGNQMQIMIPLELIGLKNSSSLNLEFKWADNYQGEDDLYSFYLNGDAAPYGRLNYTYQSKGFVHDLDMVYFHEMEIKGREVVDTRPSVTATISGNELTGEWINSREGSSSLGPERVYDGDRSTSWNPQAKNYASGEGIVLKLNKAYDLQKIELIFGLRRYYFDLSISHDGVKYTKLLSVNAENADDFYSDYVCTLPDLSSYGVKYVKIDLKGDSENKKWITLYEAIITGKETP